MKRLMLMKHKLGTTFPTDLRTLQKTLDFLNQKIKDGVIIRAYFCMKTGEVRVIVEVETQQEAERIITLCPLSPYLDCRHSVHIPTDSQEGSADKIFVPLGALLKYLIHESKEKVAATEASTTQTSAAA